MSKRNVYEIFEDFKLATTKAERIQVLRKNDSYALRNVLYGALNPNIEFKVDIPEFKRVDIPQGMSYSHMTDALQKAYLFQPGHPKLAPSLTEKRKSELLTQILESLEEREADVYISMLKKNLKIPYLTEALVNEAFPQFLPQHKPNTKTEVSQD